MKIAEELRVVAEEFVPLSWLVPTLQAQEGLTDIQMSSWFRRHMRDFEPLQAIAYSVAEGNFEHDDGNDAAKHIFDSVFYGDEVFATLDWNSDQLTGYELGYLRRDLERFFSKVGVELPIYEPINPVPLPTVANRPPPPRITRTAARDDLATVPACGDEAESPARADEAKNPNIEDDPLSTKERTTLLSIIGVLARELRFDLARPSKTASALVNAAQQAGVDLRQRTVEEVIKRVPDALDRRST